MIDRIRSGRKLPGQRGVFPLASLTLAALTLAACASESRQAGAPANPVSPFVLASRASGAPRTTVLRLTPSATVSANAAFIARAPVETARPVARLPFVKVQAAGQESAVDATSSASVKEPKLAHAVAGHEQCLSCHSTEGAAKAGTKAAPAGHEGRTDDLCLYCHPAIEGSAVVPPLPEKPTSAFCLGCHGPFEALAKRTEGFKTEEDEKANPHLYIPHDTKKIARCVDCHETHPLPVIDPSAIAKPGLQLCFSCHHRENFQACTDCHQK